MGAKSIRKGKVFERHVAQIFRLRFPWLDARRGQQTRDGADAPDVICPGLWIEAKHRDRLDVYDHYEQAVDDARGRALPVAIVRKTGRRILAVLDVADFLDLLADAGRITQENTDDGNTTTVLR